MKKLVILIFAPFYLFAMDGIVMDEYHSPISGAYNLRYLHNSLCEWDDAFLASENKGRTLYKWGRFGELLLWNPINMMIAVTQHEFFGHGYRLRTLGIGPIKYGITPLGGYTEIQNYQKGTLEEVLAISVAGLEAEAILAHQMKEKWMETGAIDGRESTLYVQVAQSLFWYTLVTVIDRAPEGRGAMEGNDVEAYLDGLSKLYPEHPTPLKKLMRLAVYNWLDPMTFFAYYSQWHYIMKGEAWRFPAFTLKKGVRYLPNVRIGYAPYGPEVIFDNYFSIHNRPLYFYMKRGDQSRGVGFECKNILSEIGATLGLRVDAWEQTKVEILSTHGEEGLQLFEGTHEIVPGMAASLMCEINLAKSTALFAEIGGKTSGYLPGYALGKGIVMRIGLSLR